MQISTNISLPVNKFSEVSLVVSGILLERERERERLTARNINKIFRKTNTLPIRVVCVFCPFLFSFWKTMTDFFIVNVRTNAYKQELNVDFNSFDNLAQKWLIGLLYNLSNLFYGGVRTFFLFSKIDNKQ
jgi:hypothetical protein